MKASGSLFTEKEIQKMASPERLDTMVAVTKQRGWWALLALCLLIVELLVWSIWGSLAITIKGQGIMLRSHVVQVEAGANGRVLALLPVGARVVAGKSVIAQLDLSGSIAERNLEQMRLNGLLTEHERATTQETQALEKKFVALADEQRRLPLQIEAAKTLLVAREAAYRQAEANLANGIVVKAAVTTSLQEKTDAKLDLEKKENRFKSIESEMSTARTESDAKIATRKLEINNLTEKVVQMTASIDSGKDVKASVSGTILEHSADANELVTPKSALMTIEPNGTTMEAVIYVPAEDAKKIPVNGKGIPLNRVPARISPSTVKVEEFGFMLGEVQIVAAYPASPEGVKRVLRNDALVQKLMEKGPPIEVRAKLKLREEGKEDSGYLWSSSKGPGNQVVTGTMCIATFEIERKRPISYVIPLFKKTMGL
jgi:HlyD family secretion protein